MPTTRGVDNTRQRVTLACIDEAHLSGFDGVDRKWTRERKRLTEADEQKQWPSSNFIQVFVNDQMPCESITHVKGVSVARSHAAMPPHYWFLSMQAL